ncbi:hypothetical protein Vafri_12478 [Volvox africanus]|nr:hypothetical protein Vafri_12478 [Volvox africanus]
MIRPPSELTAERVTNVRMCCLWGQGMVIIRVRAVKDAFVAGETVLMLLEIENHTNLAFNDVSVSVERIVNLMASGSQHTVTDRITKQKFPGLPKSTTYVSENARRMALQLPISLVPTTSGGLIKCSYQACLELSAGLLTNNARLVVPLTIYAAPPPHEAYSMAPPAFWHPQMVAPAVEVAVGVPVVTMQSPIPSAPPEPGPAKGMPNPTYAGAI